MSISQVKAEQVFQKTLGHVKPTVATILREYKLISAKDAAQKHELDTLMSGGLSIERHFFLLERKREEEERLEKDTVNRRKLENKLKWERIALKAQQRMERNKLRAQQLKLEEIRLKQELDTRKEEYFSKARGKKHLVNAGEIKSLIAVANNLKGKEYQAKEVKEETSNLLQTRKEFERQEEKKRQDRIQKIKAASLVTNKLKDLHVTCHSRLAIEVSDYEAKIRMMIRSNENGDRIQRKKVQNDKVAKQALLNEALNKIKENHNDQRERRKSNTLLC